MAQRNDNERIAVERKHTGGSPWLWILGAIALVAIALFLLIPLFNDEGPLTPGNATISDISGALDTYEGQSVLLTGQVVEVLNSNAFVMTGGVAGQEAAVAGNESILVVGANQNMQGIDDQLLNDSVFVGGIVREFNIGAVEDEVGYDLDDAMFADWAGRPVIVATALQLAGAAPTAPGNATIPEILQTPDQYIGKHVIIAGETLDVLDTNGIVVAANAIEPGMEMADAGLLVLGTQEGLFSFDDEWLSERVLASGIVRSYPDLATLETEIGYDLDDAIYTPFVNKPVLLATAMQQANAIDGAAMLGQTDYANVSVADIVGEFDTYVGRQVAVQSNVEEVISPQAFTLDEDALLEGGIDNDLLVISANQNLGFINEEFVDDGVVVAGTVRQFVIADIERELGYDLDDNLFTDWADKPVIVANVVRQLDLEALAPAPPAIEPAAPALAAETPDPAAMREAALTEGNITVAEITSNLSEFVGREVAVTSDVEEVIGPTAFSLDEDAAFAGGIDNDLLVVSANQNPAVAFTDVDDRTVMVRGTVRAFDLAAFENELGYDLDDALYADWVGRPAIVATTVEPLEPMAEAQGIAPDFANVTVAEITGDLPRFAGQTVAVREEVEEVLSLVAFTLDEDAFLAGGIDNDLLVLSAKQSPAIAFTDIEDEAVTVIGTVRAFNLADFENELGYDLDDALYADWEGRSAIIAAHVFPATAEFGYGVAAE
ncbi:MAG: hypothetical protein M3R24_27260 [Chloroflexota bacterium]|nr:hypothetical protein [Chloroflexota bacterium]